MAKEYTDYLFMMLSSGDRVYDLEHARCVKGRLLFDSLLPIQNGPGSRPLKTPDTPIKYAPGLWVQMNGHKYLLNLDRAYRINWAAWKKLVIKKPYWKNFYKPILELVRSKKVGILYYQEPCNHKCSKHPECQGEKPCRAPDLVEPMHISKIHQPSGEMR
jgi:hypothetical protein